MYDTDQDFTATVDGGVTTKRGFRLGIDRYHYDFGLIDGESGWAQVDTTQDASYFGTWANPETRKLFSFTEGDTCLQEARTDDEFVAIIRECEAWNRERGFWRGIDCGLGARGERIAARFREMGLGDLLH